MAKSFRKSAIPPQSRSNETQYLTCEIIEAFKLGQGYISRLNALITAACEIAKIRSDDHDSNPEHRLFILRELLRVTEIEADEIIGILEGMNAHWIKELADLREAK